MKRRFHFSGSAAVACYAGYRELWAEVPGTGQSIMALMASGWSRLEIARYFPFTLLNIIALFAALVWAGVMWKRSAKQAEG